MFVLMQTSVKMKLLCVQVAKDLLGDGIDVRLHFMCISHEFIAVGSSFCCHILMIRAHIWSVGSVCCLVSCELHVLC